MEYLSDINVLELKKYISNDSIYINGQRVDIRNKKDAKNLNGETIELRLNNVSFKIICPKPFDIKIHDEESDNIIFDLITLIKDIPNKKIRKQQKVFENKFEDFIKTIDIDDDELILKCKYYIMDDLIQLNNYNNQNISPPVCNINFNLYNNDNQLADISLPCDNNNRSQGTDISLRRNTLEYKLALLQHIEGTAKLFNDSNIGSLSNVDLYEVNLIDDYATIFDGHNVFKDHTDFLKLYKLKCIIDKKILLYANHVLHIQCDGIDVTDYYNNLLNNFKNGYNGYNSTCMDE